MTNFLKDLSPETMFCGFPSRRQLQTLSHSHDVIFCLDWPWLSTTTFNANNYTSQISLNLSRSCCIMSWLKRFYLESLSKTVVEFGQLISLQNRYHSYRLDLLLHGRSCCLIHWSWEMKLWNSNYDLPRKQKPGLIWYKMIVIIKWIGLFGPACN